MATSSGGLARRFPWLASSKGSPAEKKAGCHARIIMSPPYVSTKVPTRPIVFRVLASSGFVDAGQETVPQLHGNRLWLVLLILT